MENSPNLDRIYQVAVQTAMKLRKEYLIPEFPLYFFLSSPNGEALMKSYQSDADRLAADLEEVLTDQDNVSEDVEDYELLLSEQMGLLLNYATDVAKSAGKNEVDIPHFINAILHLGDDSMARYLLLKYTTRDEAELMSTVIAICNGETVPVHARQRDYFEDCPYPYGEGYGGLRRVDDEESSEPSDDWRSLVTCINDLIKDHNPLIGREAELARTIQVLCRKDKNNPLHIGEPGVGKTALVYGLAALIESGNVPQRLKGAKIYQMDMGVMVAGTSYRGDFEKKVKMVMDGVRKEVNSIVYIDEIHTLVGSGMTDGSSLDGSNMLKPFLEEGQIRFIGSTTYQEYNRYFQQSKGLVRRFQQIDIPEPTAAETIQILEGLRSKYEDFHGIKYAEGVMNYAVEVAAKRMADRFLPDKAIDLIDEAGAYRQMHPVMRKVKGVMQPQKTQWVDRSLINEVLARICKIDPKTLDVNDNQDLETLEPRIKSQIYGQDTAVLQIVESVQMGKAGLLDEGKPIASFLFVGPTGVGKTEVCKVLAKEMGIEMVRFDMSEYAEKHAVAKLIGSPAGYVGYEDGGLLTDAIRKTPHCVLLLDEIEKAHSDICNILLQVMDYASLTDNKGQKADFRHVILVMTSNAGAQHAHQGGIGFGASVSAGTAMLQTVKKTFKPEFLARLSNTVVFNDMDRKMAGLILDKKLRQLSDRLAVRNVTLRLLPAAHDLLLSKGFTPKNGAREMDRQINQLLSPVLMRAILFGRLNKGGEAIVDADGDTLKIV